MKYEKNLYKNLIKYFILVFVILSLLIVFLYYFVFLEVDRNEVYKEFIDVEENIEKILKTNKEFFEQNKENIEKFIEKENKDFIKKAYEYRNSQSYGFSCLTFDREFNLTNKISIKNKLSKTNYQYIKILIKDFDFDKFYSYGNFSEDTKIIYIQKYNNGYLAMNIDSYALFKILDKKSKNYIITNKHGRIITKGSNIKEDSPKFDIDLYDKDYIIYKKSIDDFNIYVIKEEFFTKDLFLIIFLALCLISLIYIFVISLVTKKISKSLSLSLNNLIDQISKVSSGEVEKINIKTDDETKYISDNINTLIDNVKKLESKNTSLRYEKKASEVKTMESQFNPHFLYNTLDIISYQMYVDKDSCQKLISNLSNILRYSINNMSFVFLEEDLEYIMLYMEIQKIKHQDLLEFNLRIEKSLKKIMVPKLFIQPILENSLKYGLSKKNYIRIDLDIYKKNSKINIDIKDSGEKLTEYKIKKLNKTIEEKSQNSFLTDDHHGLENSLKRLKILYKDAKLEFIEDENVIVRISFRGKDESNNSRR